MKTIYFGIEREKLYDSLEKQLDIKKLIDNITLLQFWDNDITIILSNGNVIHMKYPVNDIIEELSIVFGKSFNITATNEIYVDEIFNNITIETAQKVLKILAVQKL